MDEYTQWYNITIYTNSLQGGRCCFGIAGYLGISTIVVLYYKYSTFIGDPVYNK